MVLSSLANLKLSRRGYSHPLQPFQDSWNSPTAIKSIKDLWPTTHLVFLSSQLHHQIPCFNELVYWCALASCNSGSYKKMKITTWELFCHCVSIFIQKNTKFKGHYKFTVDTIAKSFLVRVQLNMTCIRQNSTQYDWELLFLTLYLIW